jgi:hypothetical protein
MLRSTCVASLALSALLLPSLRAAEEPPALEPTKTWQGSVADEKLGGGGPAFLATDEDLAKLWKAWQLEGKPPEVDFEKELVVVATTRGSRLNLRLKNEAGNLRILALATKDLRPGFRYVLASVPRKGIKTVEGKELK